MISFKQFLEAKRADYESETHSDPQKIADLILAHCSDANEAFMNDSKGIYRGWKTTKKSGVYRPDTGTRSSENTENFYTVLLDTNPLNKGFPLRSKSFVASTSHKTAGGYGERTQLFPFNGVKIGFVNRPDIWRTILTFPDLGFEDNILALQKFWKYIMGPSLEPESMEEAIEYLRKKDPKDVMQVFKDLTTFEPPAGEPPEETVKRIIKDLPTAYSYQKMGCDVMTIGNYDSTGNSEVWFSGPCVLVSEKDQSAVGDILNNA